MTKIKEFVQKMNSIIPESYAESYDNVGLLVGDGEVEIKGVLCSLDCLESVVDDAIKKGCNLIVSHHPIVFRGLKQIHNDYYIHRVVRKAIKNDIALYAAHTNLDNVLQSGVNHRIADKLGIMDRYILSPKQENHKIAVYASALRIDILENILTERYITWQKWPIKDKHRADYRLEIELSVGDEQKLAQALSKEEFAYEVLQKNRLSAEVGSGLIGSLTWPLTEKEFLAMLRQDMKTDVVRHTAFLEKSISKVAICGGSGSFLLSDAIRAGADALVSADFKYHEFFDADGKILIADIGHYESEQFTINLLQDIIKENFTTFAVHLTDVLTNPVNYYYG